MERLTVKNMSLRTFLAEEPRCEKGEKEDGY
jgi:hypothetical protein